MTGIERLHEIMTRLRDPQTGCPWDREQTLSSLKPCVLEETYELLAAMDRPEDKANHIEELGDVLLQVMFQSVMAEQEKRFTFDDVANAIADKLVYRHPHVFGDVEAKDAATVLRNWEQLKQLEHKKESRHSALDGVPPTLPGLLKAQRTQEKAARVGFDWKDAEGPLAKIREELAELEALENAKIESITDVNGLPGIKVTFDSGILFEFNKSNVSATAKKDIADFASMKTKFEETAKAMSHQSDEIGRKADGLANALRRNHKDVGNWGEVQLHNILDDAGFVRGRDYDTEVTLKNEQGERIYNDESGKAMRPDAILHFPDGYDVIVDSKVSLDAMLDYTAEDANEQQKEDAAERNLRAVREQIKNLSAKSYHDYHKKKGIKTVDYVMMFIPNYGVFQLAKQKEPNLFSDAFRQNVLITTEETIMPFLHMIHTAWINQEQINGMEEIVKQATYMVERVATFAEAHHKMGDKLRDAQKEFDRCDAMLKEGGQSILHAAHAVTGCGIKISPKKQLPELEG